MSSASLHLSDHELVLSIDGELRARDVQRVESHLAACWTCRARKHEFESAIANYVRLHQQNFEVQLPPSDGPRALLKAHLSELAKTQPSGWQKWLPALRLAALAAGVIAVTVITWVFLTGRWSDRDSDVAVAVPDPRLTPGATVRVSRREICQGANTKNKAVPASLRRQVFEAYGIPRAKPKAYEVDYLITPALGGADDIHNLWPHSYAKTAWNAEVKDELEDHLRDLVCEGKVDLATAQQEIAANWIEAYKKYFNTDRPLTTAR